jgi:hypothetical protein
MATCTQIRKRCAGSRARHSLSIGRVGTTAGREIAHLSPGAVFLPETPLPPQNRGAYP